MLTHTKTEAETAWQSLSQNSPGCAPRRRRPLEPTVPNRCLHLPRSFCARMECSSLPRRPRPMSSSHAAVSQGTISATWTPSWQPFSSELTLGRVCWQAHSTALVTQDALRLSNNSSTLLGSYSWPAKAKLRCKSPGKAATPSALTFCRQAMECWTMRDIILREMPPRHHRYSVPNSVSQTGTVCLTP